MRRIIGLIIIYNLIFATISLSQIYISDSARISLFSATTDDSINATNTICVPIMNMSTSEFDICLKNNTFEFAKPIQKEHFEQDGIESDKYPETVFSGKIVGIVDYLGDGNYDVTLTGIMNMHGVKRKIIIPGVITVKGYLIYLYAKFNIKIADYKIKLPSISGVTSTDNVDVTLTATMKPYKR